jgi:uncharacterized repeat protein (TIGR01451 family)
MVGGQPASAYLNYAEIASSPNFDPDSTPGNNSTTEDDNASAGPAISDLSLAKTLALATGGDVNGNGRIDVGDTVTFTLTVSNAGPAAVSGVSVTDSVPAGYTGISGITGGGTASGSTITWNALSVATSGTLQVSFNAVMTGGVPESAYRNYAEIASSPNLDPDSTPGNSSTIEDDNASASPPISDLSLNKTVALAVGGDANGNGRIDVGDTVLFSLTVANTGPAAANGVNVTDLVPAGYSGIANISNSGSLNGNLITWSGLNVSVSGTSQVSFTAVVAGSQPASAYLNYAEIAASPNFDPDSTPGNGSTTEDDNASAGPAISDLSLAKALALAAGGDVNGNGRIDVGDTVTFTLTVNNAGPAAANGVSVTDSVPAGYTSISGISGGGSLSGNTITWNTPSWSEANRLPPI